MTTTVMSRRVVVWRFIGVGWFVSICIVGGVFTGRWLDSRFNTSPVLIIIGLVLGCILALYGVYHMLTSAEEDPKGKEGG